MNEKQKSASDDNSNEDNKNGQDKSQKSTPFPEWPWYAQLIMAIFVLVAIIVLLVGLPVLSILIVERIPSPSGSLLGTVSFWGASFAAFISLAVVFIGSIFVFTTLKVEAYAKQEAKNVAEEETKNMVPIYFEREVNKQIQETGKNIINEKTDKYVKDNANSINQVVAKKYMDRFGDTVLNKAAQDYVNDNAEQLRTLINEYANNNGEPVIREEAYKYIKDAADVKMITRQALSEYLKEDIEGKSSTRGEKITREVAEKFISGEIEIQIKQKPAPSESKSWWQRYFKSQDSNDEPGSPNNR